MAPAIVLGLEIQTILLCGTLFVFVLWLSKRPKNLPPGPWGWPLLGYLPNLIITLYREGLYPHQLFTKMATKFGPVFSMRIGGKVVVILNNYQLIKQAFTNPHLNDRPLSHTMEELGLGRGLALANGDSWKQQRRFTLITLRSFGVGKRRFEDCIAEEAEYLSEEITNLNGAPLDVRNLFTNASANIICSVVFGKRYGYSDSNFKYLLGLINENAKLFGAGGMQLFFPVAKYLQPGNYKQIKKNRPNLIKFVTDLVKQHEISRDPDDPNDYIDVYLNEIESIQDREGKSHVTLENMAESVLNLFGAGSETTATALRWMVLYMMAYPNIQERIQQEIDLVVGRDRLPRLSDKDDLPFTSAVILEVQRIASIAPLGLMHSCGEDTTINGYNIPKGSVVFPNLYAVHYNPDTWRNPADFNPERFLDKDGCLQQREELIPFSTGRRICIGEHLAKMEVYIFFSHLLHRFTFKKPNDSKPISFKSVVGLVQTPEPFLTEMIQRD